MVENLPWAKLGYDIFMFHRHVQFLKDTPQGRYLCTLEQMLQCVSQTITTLGTLGTQVLGSYPRVETTQGHPLGSWLSTLGWIGLMNKIDYKYLCGRGRGDVRNSLISFIVKYTKFSSPTYQLRRVEIPLRMRLVYYPWAGFTPGLPWGSNHSRVTLGQIKSFRKQAVVYGSVVFLSVKLTRSESGILFYRIQIRIHQYFD